MGERKPARGGERKVGESQVVRKRTNSYSTYENISVRPRSFSVNENNKKGRD